MTGVMDTLFQWAPQPDEQQSCRLIGPIEEILGMMKGTCEQKKMYFPRFFYNLQQFTAQVTELSRA